MCRSKGKERSIPLYPAAVKALQDYVLHIRERIVTNDEEKALFVNMNGERMTRQGFWKIIKHYQEKADIKKDITPHMLGVALYPHQSVFLMAAAIWSPVRPYSRSTSAAFPDWPN